MIFLPLETPKLALDAIRTSLVQNEGLKVLRLIGHLLFREDFSSEINFKLKRLSFGPATYEHETQHNFNFFLKTQRQNLEILTIGGFIDIPVLKTIFSMPSLKAVCFTMNTIQGLEISETTFPQNPSVVVLVLTEFWVFQNFRRWTLQISPTRSRT